MTRVERINKAIAILHLNKQLNPKQIKEVLKSYGHDVDLHVIVAICVDNQPVPVKSRAPSKDSPQEIRRKQLDGAFAELMVSVEKHKIPFSFVARYLNSLGLHNPTSLNRWTNKSVKQFLVRRKLHKKRTGIHTAHCISYEEWRELVPMDLENKLTQIASDYQAFSCSRQTEHSESLD